MTIRPTPDGEDERSFSVVPGDPESSVIIHVPHASRVIPAAVRDGLFLDDAALERELDAMTDACTDVIAAQVAARSRVRPWLFVNGRSRLVVDPERVDDDGPEVVRPVGWGTVYTGTSDGFVLRDPSDDEVSGLLVRYLEPYAEALATLVQQRGRAAGRVTIIDLHSYPLQPLECEPDGDAPRPEVGLGADETHTPAELLEAARSAFAQFEIVQDAPFAGCYVPPAHDRGAQDVRVLGVELRRDLYLDDDNALVEPAIAPIVDALTSLLTELDESLSDTA
jgi:N-formylglutamate deformylase